MANFKYSALGLPEYLFQEQSQTSPQISPGATFDPVNAIGGGGGFVSQTAPNQQPKKKEIYLDYKSIFRLWKPDDVALVIAKLKKEGFEIYFIQNSENNDIFKSKIDDSKFKDKKGNSQNVFSLSDDFIKDNFSQQTHEKSAEKLKLARDDSIILDYAQFKEIHSILTQENWVDEEKVNVKSHLAWSLLDGSTKKSESYEDIVKYAETPSHDTAEVFTDLISHKDFNINDQNTKIAFCSSYNRVIGDYFSNYCLNNLDKKKLGDVFDTIPSLTNLQEVQKNFLQKAVLKQLWFEHPNFKEGVIKRAQTLGEFENSTPHEIGTSLYGDLNKFSEEAGKNLLKNYSLDISERYPENLNIFKFLSQDSDFYLLNYFSALVKHQKEETKFGQKFEVNFTAEDGNEGNFIKYKLSGPKGEKHEASLTLESFIQLFSDSEINRHLKLTEQFGDALIANLKQETALNAFKKINSGVSGSFYPKIAEQLNENQRKQFLDDLLDKASSIDIDALITKGIGTSKSLVMPVFLFAQNNLDNPKMKKLAETMLIRLTEYIEKKFNKNNYGPYATPKDAFTERYLVFNNLNPEFQDFLIEMDKGGKIKLNEILFHSGEEIYAKFDKDPLRHLSNYSGGNVMPRNTYLENYKKIMEMPTGVSYLSWDKSKVSSEKLPTSPLQINLFDLNIKTLNKIKSEIKNKELNASEILSLKIFGSNSESEIKDDNTTSEEKLNLLRSLTKLFPNLKHVKVYTEGIEPSQLAELNKTNYFKEGTTVFDIHNSDAPFKTHDIFDTPITPNFKATKSNDIIYIGDAESFRAEKKDSKSQLLMEEAGKIISRPEASSTTALRIRDSLLEMNPDFSKPEDELLVKIKDNSSPINLDNCKKNEDDFNKQKDGLSSAISLDQTICSFTRNLQRNKKTTLPSISSDNEIIGYYTDPPKANVKFFKDEKSGFYYAQSDKKCRIDYIIQGRELKLLTPTANLDDLPDKVKKILEEYTKKEFLFSVNPNQYELPDFKNKNAKQFLDELFNIENKGACRHRVAALAHKFLQKESGLKYDEDFRITGINQNHVALEIMNKEKNLWIPLDLGGETVDLVKKEGNRNSDLGIAPQSKKDYRCFSALANGFKSSIFPCLAYCRNVIAYPFKNLHSSISNLRKNTFFPESIPSAEPSSPQLLSKNALLIEEKLKNLNQLEEIKDLTTFKENFKNSMKEKKSSLFLKTDQGEELKNYLLKMGSSLRDSGASVSNTRTSETSFETFCISSPDLTVKKPTLNITQDNQIVKITDTTPLFSFLKKANIESGKQHVLIIDWGKFNASSQVAFNTMFDTNRKIDNEEIPDNVTIVCVDSSKQKITDSSILSRFGKSFNLSSIGKNQYTDSLSKNSSPNKKIIEIDGEGFVNWQEKLFGRVVLNCDKMEWQKSDFVKSLESLNPSNFDSKNLELNFKNFSSEQQKEMKLFFDQGKSSGSINYNNYEIKIPSDLTVDFVKKEFEFAEVLNSFKKTKFPPTQPQLDIFNFQGLIKKDASTLSIYQDSLGSNKLPKDVHLINSHLFDKLLAQPKIKDGKYHEELGLIQESIKSGNGTLKLFLSENLSNRQFYCLLNQAKQHEVSLELYLAKDVKMPDKGFDNFLQERHPPIKSFDLSEWFQDQLKPLSEIQSIFSPNLNNQQKRIIITNNIEESLAEFKQNQPPGKALNLVNIEDVLYGDLFEKNQHKLTQNRGGTHHFSFEKIESDIKTKLEKGEIVVLKGQFSDELLSILHPQILDMQQKFSNLHFIIEDKNISESKSESTKLSWLDSSLYQVKHTLKTAKQAGDGKIGEGKFVQEPPDCVGDQIPENSSLKAQEFIDERKKTLKDLLEKNSALQIFGHSGVGKSSLFLELKNKGFTTKDDVAIYNELSSFEKWVKDKSLNKTKILVIDEFNVDGSTNFTTFRDLANSLNSPQQIFHQGKFYNLDENHKVVFLGNPKSYGNRFEQKVFEDCKVKEWRLNDFPVSYIYENILNKPIFEGLSLEVKNSLTKETFKQIATKEITSYKEINHNKGIKDYNDLEYDDLPKETVRELQEKVLKEIAKKIRPISLGNVENNTFIATEANQESIAELQSAIQIRQLQKSGEIPPQSLGTCGVIFKGDSGVGKSVMIEAVLENRGITKTTSLENLDPKNHYYYKIPASLPMEKIKENLIKAFELGVIVVFDEMNTRIHEGGLEKDINALLTGQHPNPKDPTSKPKAGFMIIASVNQATDAGRSNFSSAIEHRCNMISAKPLSEYQKEDFEKIIKNWIENDNSPSPMKQDESKIQEIAKSFKNNLDKNPSACNLRDLKKVLPELLKYSNSQEASRIIRK